MFDRTLPRILTRTLALAAALGLAALPARADLPCLDAQTTRAAADLVLPAAMGAVADKCGGDYARYAPTIAADRATLPSRFQHNADRAWPVVRDFVANSTDPKLAQARREIGRSEAFARAFVTALLSTELARKLDARTCAAVDTVMQSILPLSDDQIGTIGAAMIRLALLDPRVAAAGVRTCPAGER